MQLTTSKPSGTQTTSVGRRCAIIHSHHSQLKPSHPSAMLELTVCHLKGLPDAVNTGMVQILF
uniref:Uncharacterized protein n=1 Tax=Anguilla anguilla TaxID=7936 RepID=A0A0E9R722_ANGAN